ncbi:MAG TPA: peptidase dimerization domain-containing protein, partial [Phycisphaerae bacterium]|nr:peptidase dimerization domain-containing protein [Phycisphaerae bacterium]
TVAYTPGWSAANVDSVDITIFGRGGHGARPNSTVDPIVTAAYVITQLQTLVSRRVDPIEPAVVTVGSIHGGAKHNVIPDEVKLQLTVRSYTDAVRHQLLDGIRQITTDVCKSFGCPKPPAVVVDDETFTPACYNDPALTLAAAGVFRKLLGDDHVVEDPPEMGGEDFGQFARALNVPGLQYGLGSISPETYQASLAPGAEPLPSLHSSRYRADTEDAVRYGVSTMTMLTLALLPAAE